MSINYNISVPGFLPDMLRQPHLLIGGTTGSGKSVLINDLIYTLIASPPSVRSMILIDPKGCELVNYAKLPHTYRHAVTASEIVSTCKDATALMDSRFREMAKKGLRTWAGSQTYIIIDEYAFIRQMAKAAEPFINDIAYRGRAAGLHLIIATQRPTRDIITGIVAANMPSQVALRTRTRQESVNIIGVPGAELLPKHGEALYYSPDIGQNTKIYIPYVTEAEIQKLIKAWKKAG